jgi:riboflavin kinase/FMN adenylyltransferase
MEVIRGLHNLRQDHCGSVVTIGNFDGVHRGHQAILKRIRQKSEQMGVPSMLICFEPQPKEFFDPANAPARLSRFREKLLLLEEQGLDAVLCFHFNEATRNLTAHQFIDNLVSKIQVQFLFVGDDFRFGQDQAGDFELLKKAGQDHGFEVTNQYTFSHEDERVSSTRIRECLASGDFELAEELLGRPYSIMGKIVYGRQLGRQLDAPTANIQLHRYRAPLEGVYAIEMTGLDKIYRGVANVGVRPTVDSNAEPILEVHLFDFSDDIYGRNVSVVFRKKIRDEKKFDSLDELKTAIHADFAQARQFFDTGNL